MIKNLFIMLLGMSIGSCITIFAMFNNLTLLQHEPFFRHSKHLPPSKDEVPDVDLRVGSNASRSILRGLRSEAEENPRQKDIADHQCRDFEVTNGTAAELYKRVRVLCWIMTSPKTLYTKAIHIKKTWGKHCNAILYMSSIADEDFPAVGLPVDEGRVNLYEKTKAALRYVWKNHRNDADWFLKADDDTFVILENLRYLLKDYDTNEPMYFGRKFHLDSQHLTYMSGGAGYVLSKEALSRFSGAFRHRKCPQGTAVEDFELGQCLKILGVKAMDSRDEQNIDTFFPFNPASHLRPGKLPKDFWFWKYVYYPNPSGQNCCSNVAISFHYINPDLMNILYYFVYHLRVFGIDKINQTQPIQMQESNQAMQDLGNQR